MSTGVSFTLEQDSQKSGGAMPPSLKSGGATGPLPPFPRSAAYVTNYPFLLLFQFSFLQNWLEMH